MCLPGKSKVIQLKNDNYCMSSNVNGVVRAVLNLFSFLRKDFTRTNTETQRRKSTKSTKTQLSKKHKKHRLKTQPSKSTNPSKAFLPYMLFKHRKTLPFLVRLFASLCFCLVWNLLLKKNYNNKEFKTTLMIWFTLLLSKKLFLLLSKTYQLFLLFLNSQTQPLGKPLWLTRYYATPEVTLFVIITCYWQGTMPCLWSYRDFHREWYGFERAYFTLSCFLPYILC